MSRPLPTIAVSVIGGVVVGAVLFGGIVASPQGPPGGLEVAEQNLDANGHIKVHEQGVASVFVTNPSLVVEGTVEVNNLPSTQDVNVTNPSLNVSVDNFPATPVATQAHQIVVDLPASGFQTYNLSAMVNASLIAIQGNEEVLVSFSLGSFTWFRWRDEAEKHSEVIPLTLPIPIDNVSVGCSNESQDCNLVIYLVGS